MAPTKGRLGNLVAHLAKPGLLSDDAAYPELLCIWSKPADSLENPEVMCIRFNDDGSILAAGCGDGIVRLYNRSGEDVGLLYDKMKPTDDRLPNMCIRFRPMGSGTGKKIPTVIVANTQGTIEQYDLAARSCIHTIEEPGNQTLAIDYSPSGNRFASGGRDRLVRIYDGHSLKLLISLCGVSELQHMNRLLAVRMIDEHTVLSGGLDGTVKCWDLQHLDLDKNPMLERYLSPTWSVSGVDIRGDAIDLHRKAILTGSWRPTEQIQLWDVGTGQPLPWDLPWQEADSKPSRDASPKKAGSRWEVVRKAVIGSCNVYGAQFSVHDDGATIIAGGSGNNELKVWSRIERRALGAVVVDGGVLGLHLTKDGKFVAVAAGDKTVRVYKMPPAPDSHNFMRKNEPAAVAGRNPEVGVPAEPTGQNYTPRWRTTHPTLGGRLQDESASPAARRAAQQRDESPALRVKLGIDDPPGKQPTRPPPRRL